MPTSSTVIDRLPNRLSNSGACGDTYHGGQAQGDHLISVPNWGVKINETMIVRVMCRIPQFCRKFQNNHVLHDRVGNGILNEAKWNAEYCVAYTLIWSRPGLEL